MGGKTSVGERFVLYLHFSFYFHNVTEFHHALGDLWKGHTFYQDGVKLTHGRAIYRSTIGVPSRCKRAVSMPIRIERQLRSSSLYNVDFRFAVFVDRTEPD